MSELLVGVVVTVPEEYFPDGDDICITAGHLVCGQLKTHLVQHGHSIPNWIQGGCDEDWGVYFESEFHETKFEYHITFFPGPRDTMWNQILIQYHVRLPFIKRLFRRPAQLSFDHQMHTTMRSFGELFSSSRMLTETQLEREF